MTPNTSRFVKPVLMPLAISLIAAAIASCGPAPNTTLGKVWNGNPSADKEAETTMGVDQQRDVLLAETVRVQRLLPQLKDTPPTRPAVQTDGCIQNNFSGFPKLYLRSNFGGCNWTANPDDSKKSRRHELKGTMEFTDNSISATGFADAVNTRTAVGDLEVTVLKGAAKKMVTKTTWHQEATLTLANGGWYPVASSTAYGGLNKNGFGSWKATHSGQWQITPNPTAALDGAPLSYTMKEGSTLSLNYQSTPTKKPSDKGILFNMIARSPVVFVKDQHGCWRATGSFDWEQDNMGTLTTGSFTVGSSGLVDPKTHAAKPWKNDCMK